MTGYELSRQWFDWSFENPHLSTPNHTALYLWYVEKWNRCGQKDKFSVTTSESMEAIGIKSRNTLSNTFKDLVSWNFIIIITESKNQYSCSVISLAQNLSNHEYSTVASTRMALDKALIHHEYSTVASIDTINKQDNKETSKQDNKETKEEISKEILSSENNSIPKRREGSIYGDGELDYLCVEFYQKNPTKYPAEMYKDFLTYWTAPIINGSKKDKGKELWRTHKTFQVSGRLSTWHQNNLKRVGYIQPNYDKSKSIFG